MAGFDSLFADLSHLGLDASEEADYQELEQRVDGLAVVTAHGEAPFQSEGILKGMPYYFRYRRGVARLTLGADPLGEPLYVSQAAYGSKNDGALTPREFEDLMVALVPHLKRAPFRYQFRGRRVLVRGLPDEPLITPTEQPEIYSSWGFSAGEAYERLLTLPALKLSVAVSSEVREEIVRAQAIEPEPLAHDHRVFPHTDPEFTAV